MTTRPAIPEHEKAITADWMQRALSSGGAVDPPQIENVVVENIGTESGALGELLRCTLTYVAAAAQTPGSVVVKLSSSDRKSPRIAKALSLYKREYACFRQLAPHMRIGLPDLFYGDFDDASHRFVLVLEDLHGMESVDQIAGADVERTRRAIRGAAELHGQFWNRADRPPLSHWDAGVSAMLADGNRPVNAETRPEPAPRPTASPCREGCDKSPQAALVPAPVHAIRRRAGSVDGRRRMSIPRQMHDWRGRGLREYSGAIGVSASRRGWGCPRHPCRRALRRSWDRGAIQARLEVFTASGTARTRPLRGTETSEPMKLASLSESATEARAAGGGG